MKPRPIAAVALVLLAVIHHACGGNPSAPAPADGGPETVGLTHAPMTACTGGMLDPDNGLCWQDPPDGVLRTQQAAIDYCNTLTLAGLGGWRLPALDELRSLVRFCPPTEWNVVLQTGGSCRALESCTDPTCRNSDCWGCITGHTGPYWDSALSRRGLNDMPYRTSTAVTGLPGQDFAWTVFFNLANVDAHQATDPYHVRCVRTPP